MAEFKSKRDGFVFKAEPSSVLYRILTADDEWEEVKKPKRKRSLKKGKEDDTGGKTKPTKKVDR